ncbi:ROK family transcriptional regulator [Actinomyces ruminicola]|uniref:Sugar kinase of the NBD/HSP70 family, may contain an N-terminal HTH domain n=1 Tax=Actinomyces ruminicola TaxID=332524 RepID=A0A1H0CUY4_9ACTO|nr:ROK family transcriptional regulator [Actinomyces ruminicola]SDM60089.1 Sugar kinase of the NBD/HSP70 family, may contain an N-terminal HTH domain [Actinomyces ruminicola]SDN61713.1 Sugar kinase of the NBD/HSP70 family, may contain an N-terminal HTH domain [Actinomyces ruminicola]
MRAGTNLADLGRYNANVVIHALRRLGACSQRDIAAATGLSAQTVSAIVRGLQRQGMLAEVGTEVNGRGRPRILLNIVGSAKVAVGIHVDPSVITVVALDLSGSVIAVSSLSQVDPDDPHTTMARVAQSVRRLVTEHSLDAQRLAGACLAIPGPLSPVTGAPDRPAWLPGWNAVPLGGVLGGRLGISVPVVKDTLAAVIGENWVRGGDSLDSTMIFVYVGTGTGLGLSVNGEPIRGFSGNSGEVGTMMTALGSRTPGDHLGMDNDPAFIVERAHALGLQTETPPQRTDFAAVERLLTRLCAAAADGDEQADALLTAAGARMAELVMMAVELLDADTVVFGGPYWNLLRPWYAPAAGRAVRRPSARGPHPVSVLSSAMGENVGAVGAAAVVHDSLYVPRPPTSSV